MYANAVAANDKANEMMQSRKGAGREVVCVQTVLLYPCPLFQHWVLIDGRILVKMRKSLSGSPGEE
jgi:hypothetical protein